MMKNLIILLSSIYISTLCIAEKATNAEEIHIKFIPQSHYLRVDEYNLHLDTEKKKEAKSEAENIAKLVESARYSKTKYEFEHFICTEEHLVKKDKQLWAQYFLITKSIDIIGMIEDIFRTLLHREVQIDVIDKKLRLIFDKGNIHGGNTNVTGILTNSKTNQMAVIWDTEQTRTLELNLIFADVEGIPLQKYVEKSVFSPEIPKEKLDQLKGY